MSSFVFQREKRAVWPGGPPGENNHITAAQRKGEDGAAISRHRPQHTSSQSQHRHHKPVIHKPQSPTTSQDKTEKRKANERSGKDDSCVLSSLTHRPTDPLFPTTKTQTLRHGRADCGLVEAVSVSGRGNAF